MITRIAPTPSGYLHLGNAVNIQLISWLAAATDGTVALRVDDMDSERARPEYVEDIFDVLRWMGVPWSLGPRDARDVTVAFSMGLRRETYRRELSLARERGLEAYACSCSRADVTHVPTGGCPGDCRRRDLALEPGGTALRVHVPPGTAIRVGDRDVALADSMGDFVVWRRDDLPAYHLASVVEDRDLGTTHIVRGVDLIDATAAQLFLCPHLAAAGLAEVTYLHHALVTGPDGRRLSKSQCASGAPLAREPHTRTLIRRTAEEVGAPLGIRPPD